MDSDSPNVIAKRVFSKAAANLGCGIIELSSVPEEILFELLYQIQ